MISKDIAKKSNRLSSRCYKSESGKVYDFGDGVIVGLETVSGAGCVASDTCPIMLERFEDVELEVAPGKPFLPRNRELCVASLVCGHKFSILGIMYQFVMSGM